MLIKNSPILIFSLSLIFFLTACDKKKENSQRNIPSVTFSIKNLSPSAEQLVAEFMGKMSSLDTTEASTHIVSHGEYVQIYPHLPDADKNPESPKMIAQLYTSSNKKHFFRWLSKIKEDSLTYSRFEIKGPEAKYNGFSFIKGVHVYVKNPSGKETRFSMFDTILHTQDGFKVWALLDTRH